MKSEEWKKYIKNEKEKYKKLEFIECPAFGGEKVYFNNYGLDHLMYKGRIPRSTEEVVSRFKLLSYVNKILKYTKNVYNEEKRTKGESHAYFWTIKERVGVRRIRIILRRLNNGTLHFYSVMEE